MTEVPPEVVRQVLGSTILFPSPFDLEFRFDRGAAGRAPLPAAILEEFVIAETVLAGGLWRTHADPNQLENSLLNLAVNAADAMPNGRALQW